jgi:hypothetical protein
MKLLSIAILGSVLVLGCANPPSTHKQQEWKLQVFEKQSDNPAVWNATVDALRKAGVTHRLIRIEEQRWSAQPHYGIILQTTEGATVKGTVGGPINNPFSYVWIDLKDEPKNPQQSHSGDVL